VSLHATTEVKEAEASLSRNDLEEVKVLMFDWDLATDW
jgi:hypothetical protein